MEELHDGRRWGAVNIRVSLAADGAAPVCQRCTGGRARDAGDHWSEDTTGSGCGAETVRRTRTTWHHSMKIGRICLLGRLVRTGVLRVAGCARNPRSLRRVLTLPRNFCDSAISARHIQLRTDSAWFAESSGVALLDATYRATVTTTRGTRTAASSMWNRRAAVPWTTARLCWTQAWSAANLRGSAARTCAPGHTLPCV